jgi:GMP synthase-like glutamine amidotransferase
MKLLLVNNDSDTWKELYDLCVRCGFEVESVHCSMLEIVQTSNFDLVVLSGGYWYDDELQHLETYRYELALIRESTVPILGICIGMQLMQVAFSGKVPLLDSQQTGLQTIEITEKGQELFGFKHALSVHKNHTRGVLTAVDIFEVLASSPHHIEIMLHKTKPLLGVQFHPEIGDDASTSGQFLALISAITTPPTAAEAITASLITKATEEIL